MEIFTNSIDLGEGNMSYLKDIQQNRELMEELERELKIREMQYAVAKYPLQKQELKSRIEYLEDNITSLSTDIFLLTNDFYTG